LDWGLLYFYGYIVSQQEIKAFDLIKNSSNLGYDFAPIFLERSAQKNKFKTL
tara:strand:- start:922 stop:1077 length:156 start_codon:yes stop_codon:yes gene_type:complete